ncbi:hypothetical protein PHET_02657 [Paragonimus heterotremus]|uniref:PUR alpha beta gamma DNA RNA binding n=1 Tax=Paragonimus heterotremus TaxID=100268 RepID=A0A8J4SPT9_9TREM|nr:hypothetical protein PHET_02657 [Paragonimus heterotremus]
MFVRPPAVRSSRNPGRRPLPPRIPLNEINRPLLRQFVRNRRSDPRYEAYLLEVREGPAVNGNTNAAAGKSIPQPWVTVRDFVRSSQSIGLPVSVCDTLLNHLLTCAVPEEAIPADSYEESDVVCGSPATTTDPQASSPARASGDAKSPPEDATSEENSPPKKNLLKVQPKLFQLSKLKPIRIVCEATGCVVEVSAKDPNSKRTANGSEEQEKVVQADPSRRWIVSAPSETRPNSSGEQPAENNGGSGNRKRHPWESRGILELHESLMAQLSAFLADVVTRYRSVHELPEVRSLYSASGGRRFFFDLRDTRWGKRLHISQVTDLHRNVIGIPLEALVSFRSRLDTVIKSLGLEDQHQLRSEIYGTTTDRSSPRGPRRPLTSSRDRSDEPVESADGVNGGRKSTLITSNPNEPSAPRQRGRERRRQRIRSFTSGVGVGGPAGAPVSGNRVQEFTEPPADTNNRRGPVSGGPAGAVGPNQWNGGAPRNRRFARRNRNPRPFNTVRRQPNEGLTEDTNEPAVVQPAPEPAINGARVAPVAEASA